MPSRGRGGGSRSTLARGDTPATTAGRDSARADSLLERADRGRIQGNPAAPVWVVEISDFECPFCKQWHDETYPSLVREYILPGHVRMAYVNFPLQQHRHAWPAAEAAMCAAAQDKFWQMHDALFKTQERWSKMDVAAPLFDSLAVAVGVNAGEWRDCIKSGVMQRLINADRSRGTTAGLRSTPTFYVGDQPITGNAPIAVFRAAIERARAKASERTPK